ncbi:MAG: nuclear transport factor 2 family protein [Gammaproteobacteria bacterium]|nr:nuclear transport factor 2 family protein [Gammaproteobacteria bacterium]
MSQKYSYTPIFRLILSLFVLSALSLLVGCDQGGNTVKEEKALVKQVMEMRQKAIQTQDIELYKQVIFPGYKDKGVDFDGIIAEMQEIFDRYENIEFTYQRSTVDMDMNSARMVGNISYQATGMEKPVYDQERTIFRRVDGQWKISAGIQSGLF